MTLLERCEAIEKNLHSIDLWRKNRNQRQAIEQRAAELDQKLKRLTSIQEKAAWAGVDRGNVGAYIDQMASVQSHAREATQRLAVNDDPTTLVEDPLWQVLLQSTEKAATALDDEARRTWEQFKSECGALPLPFEIKGTLPYSPANEIALPQYSIKHQAYIRLSQQSLPRTEGDRLALQSAVKECRELLAQLQFSVPEAVDTFFKAVFAGGAPLSLLTAEVLAWLHENNQMNRYVVTGASRESAN